MKATEARVLDFIEKAPQFIIPIYQRSYSWSEQQCLQLWNDIVHAGSNESITGHFIGSIVYIESGLSNVTLKPPLLVIDGQQRLTTITLLLIALMDAVKDDEPFESFSKEKIQHYYLLKPLEKDERRFRLLLSETDKKTLLHLLGAPVPQESSLRITDNYDLFKKLLEKCDDIALVCKGLTKLIVVDISLDRGQDNPQLIFESMNSTGLALSQADLIRNYLLMGLDPELQKELYEHHWRPMELAFGQAAYQEHFDAFMRHYLTVKTGEIPLVAKVYETFKKVKQADFANKSIKDLISDIQMYAGYYCNMVLGAEPERELRQAFADLRDLKADVAYPLLLEWYHDYKSNTWSKEELHKATRLLESYVFRRAICSIPTNSLNKTFATFSKSTKKDHYLESVMATFVFLQSYRGFPTNEEFKRELQVRNLYKNRLRSYWARRIENHGRKELVSLSEYTVEHIMPQNPNLSAKWREDLGQNWQNVQEQWLHTLGNLTLTEYNPEYSDKSFVEKREMAGGFKESPLHLNKGLGDVAVWNEQAIKERAQKLANVAVDIWEYPSLEQDILSTYNKKPMVSEYTIEDHQFLRDGNSRKLFDALRKELLELDPCVTEDVLKLYIAYKVETNFVDVVPQAKRLRLSLNMKFYDIHDPKGMCKDVTNVGRWGNGDIEIFLADLEELPYVMSLIRQSFEKQMGGEE